MDEHHRPAFVRRLDGIEGLRGVAVASVVVYHVWGENLYETGSNLGWLGTWVFASLGQGVTLFFTLSGFLLYLPFVAATLLDQPRPRYGAYLWNRALRILPAYWVILLLIALVMRSAAVHVGANGNFGIGAITNPSLLLENAMLVQDYSRSTMNTGILPAWSLAVEVVFYLMLPLLVVGGLLLARRARTRRHRSLALLVPAALLGLVGLAGAVVGAGLGGAFDLSFLSHAHLFSLGMALAVVYVNYHDGAVRLPRHWRPVALASLPVIVIPAVWLSQSAIPERGETILFSFACVLLLALVVLAPRDQPTGGLNRTLELRPIATLGVISYSVYLWHQPIIYFLSEHNVFRIGGYVAFDTDLLVVATLTLGLSVLTYRFVEKPALRLKSQRRERLALQPAAAMATTPSPPL